MGAVHIHVHILLNTTTQCRGHAGGMVGGVAMCFLLGPRYVSVTAQLHCTDDSCAHIMLSRFWTRSLTHEA